MAEPARRVEVAWPAVARDPSPDLELQTLNGTTQTLGALLTIFNMLAVVIDPYTVESGWILPTATRLFDRYYEADVRCAFVVTADPDGARQYLGPFATDYLVLADPERDLVKSLDLERLPALVHIQQDCTLGGAAEGWVPGVWTDVLAHLELVMAWRTQPQLPFPGDPAPFPGTPALA